MEDEASSTNIDIDEHGDYEALNNDYVVKRAQKTLIKNHCNRNNSYNTMIMYHYSNIMIMYHDPGRSL